MLLNDHSMVEAAVAMAARILSEDCDDATRISHAFRLATSRLPDVLEIRSLQSLLDQGRSHYQANTRDAELLVAAHNYAKTKDPVELAAWTGVTRAILNLYETVARY